MGDTLGTFRNESAIHTSCWWNRYTPNESRLNMGQKRLPGILALPATDNTIAHPRRRSTMSIDCDAREAAKPSSSATALQRANRTTSAKMNLVGLTFQKRPESADRKAQPAQKTTRYWHADANWKAPSVSFETSGEPTARRARTIPTRASKPRSRPGASSQASSITTKHQKSMGRNHSWEGDFIRRNFPAKSSVLKNRPYAGAAHSSETKAHGRRSLRALRARTSPGAR